MRITVVTVPTNHHMTTPLSRAKHAVLREPTQITCVPESTLTARFHEPGQGGRTMLFVDDTVRVTCPYCGERVEVFVESDVHGSFIQDCEVCCNPWTVRVSVDD